MPSLTSSIAKLIGRRPYFGAGVDDDKVYDAANSKSIPSLPILDQDSLENSGWNVKNKSISLEEARQSYEIVHRAVGLLIADPTRPSAPILDQDSYLNPGWNKNIKTISLEEARMREDIVHRPAELLISVVPEPEELPVRFEPRWSPATSYVSLPEALENNDIRFRPVYLL